MVGFAKPSPTLQEAHRGLMEGFAKPAPTLQEAHQTVDGGLRKACAHPTRAHQTRNGGLRKASTHPTRGCFMAIMPKLLVSVRSVEEARAALEGGADLIDVKEPSRGPLGPADPAVIESIILEVNGRVPVSAAMGEWSDSPRPEVPSGLTFVKWGLSRLEEADTVEVSRIGRRFKDRAVLVAYADYERALSPQPQGLVQAACELKFPAFLIDTAIKDGKTLLDWVELSTLARWRIQLEDAGVPIALAGSLDEWAIRLLAPLQPDWFAVRGAACDGGREGTIRAAKVRRLKEIIAESSLQTVEG